MKVRATRLGYYNLRRRKVGAEFHIKEMKDFSKKWMFAVDKEEMNEEDAVDPAREQKVDKSMNVDVLHDYCKEHGLVGYSQLNKKDLIHAINKDLLEVEEEVEDSGDVI